MSGAGGPYWNRWPRMSRQRNIFRSQSMARSSLFAFRTPLSTALTLVEMLVAMAITLVMMAAVVNLFASVGQSVRNRQAAIELSGGLRMARLRLQQDLAGATCPTLPWQRQESNSGYLEIVEGQFSDKNPSLLLDGIDDGVGAYNRELDYTTSLVPSGGDPTMIFPPTSTRVVTAADVTNGGGLGDFDDILALTIRSEGEPFIGRSSYWDSTANGGVGAWVPGPTIESTLAEVVWYAVENPADSSLGEPGMRTIYRRALLIAPWYDLSSLPTISIPNNFSSLAPLKQEEWLAGRLKWFFDRFDISVRYALDFSNLKLRFYPNTLADLTKRENRFAHIGTPPNIVRYPWALNDREIRHMIDIDHPLEPLDGERMGEDVMLSDVLAFDLRVYDPGAPLRQAPATGTVLEPCDAGWGVDSTIPVVGYGGFVDLFWRRYSAGVYPCPPLAGAPAPIFSLLPAPKSLLDFFSNPPPSGQPQPYPSVAYDTWSFHYENDGLDQDNGWGQPWLDIPDQGTNGLDDDGMNGVDDMVERETAPPYDVPLRGLQVKLRVYDRDSRKIRETSATRNFVP
jgi:hypothetical protein